MNSVRTLLILVFLVSFVQIGASTCCPECGDSCGGDDYHGSGYSAPTSIVSISHSVTTPITSTKPSGTSVDYHVQSRADQLEGYIPLVIHFWDESYASQGVTPAGFEWDLGDGTKETKKDFFHTYTTPGTFKVIPKVRWSDGKVSIGQAAAIRAYQPAVTTPTNPPSGSGGESSRPSGTEVDYHVASKADRLDGPAPLTISFADESWATMGVVPTGYSWNLGDGTASTEKSFSHTYQTPGSYVVTPTVTFSDGKVSVGSSATIEVSEGSATPAPVETTTQEPVQTAGTLPDLKITSINPHDEVVPGSPFSADITVINNGGAPAGSFGIGGYLFAVSDYQKSVDLSEETVSGLGPGASVTKTLTAWVPAGAPGGAYDMKAFADNSNYTDAGAVIESDENNNEKWVKDVRPQQTPVPTPTEVPECEYSCHGYGAGITLASGETQGVVSAGGESTCDAVIGVTWDMGDGTILTAGNDEEVSHIYTTPGSYSPSFSISWESGSNFDTMCEADIQPVTVPASATPTPTPTPTPPPSPTSTPVPVSQPASIDYYLNAWDEPTQGEVPLSVQFRDESYATGGVTPTGWNWDLGDGSTSSDRSFSHTYSSPGVYHVTDSVTFSDGHVMVGSLSPDIRVVEYFPKMTAEPAEGDAPLVVTFRDRSSATTGIYPVAWAWEGDDGGNGFRSGQQLFTHTYAQPGTYSWTGGVVFSDGKTAMVHGTITVRQKVIPEDRVYYYTELIPAPQSGEAPLSVDFEDHSYATHGVTVSHLRTDLGDGTVISDQTRFTHVYPSPGTYLVQHTVTFSDGETGQVSGYIRVSEMIDYTVQISVSPLYGIVPLSVAFTDHSYATGGVYVSGRSWDYGDGTQGEGKVARHTYESAGTYTIRERVTFSDGHEEESETREVVVVEPEKSEGVETSAWEIVKEKETEYYPVWEVEPREGLAPLSVRYEDQSSTNKPDLIPSAWVWDLGDGTTSSEQKFTHDYPAEGTYKVSLIVTFSDGHEEAGDPVMVQVQKEGVETSSFITDRIGNETVEPEEQVSPVPTAEARTLDASELPQMKSSEPPDTRCIEDEIFSQTNEMYTGGDYLRDPFLDDMARQYSALLCEKDKNALNNKVEPKTFSHDLIGGTDGLKTRIEMAGYQYTCIGENIGHNPVLNDGSGCTDTECTGAAAKIMDGWKNSPPHYRNIMNENGMCTNTHLGVGVYECGDGCYYATQIFATPASPNQTPEKGGMNISSVPPGATAYVDGKEVGMTPTGRIEVIPGYDHTVHVTRDGYSSDPRKITVAAGETKDVSIPLTGDTDTSPGSPEGEKGTITITSDPPGAGVIIDSTIDGGVTPGDPVEVSVGSHEVSVSLDGYAPETRVVTVTAGKETPVSVTLTASDGDTPDSPPAVPPEDPQVTPPDAPDTPEIPPVNQPPANPVTTGGISFVSTPTGATTQMGGLILNRQTPFTINGIPEGEYPVRFILGDQESATRVIRVVAGQVTEISHTFPQVPTPAGTDPTVIQQPAPVPARVGTLTLDTLPSGAGVYINNWPAGRTPTGGLSVTPGTYLITFVKNGYQPEVVTGVMPSGGQVFISRSLTPLAGTRPAEPVQAADLGTLEVSSAPEGALVSIGGFQVMEKTPVIFTDLMPGEYTVKISLAGYDEYEEVVSITAGRRSGVHADLTTGEEPFDPLANLGTITITSEPEGADIFLNGFRQPDLTPADLTFINPGKHYVEVKKAGYDTFREDLTMPAGGKITIDAPLTAGGDEDATFTTEPSPGPDTGTGTVVGIGESGVEKMNPGISGERIIWTQNEGTQPFIFMHDSATGVTEGVKTGSEAHEEPAISGNYLVWSTGGEGSDIILKDLADGEEIAVTGDGLRQHSPHTDGVYVVYVESGDGGSSSDIVLYSIGTSEKTVIASGDVGEISPKVGDGSVIFGDHSSGTAELIRFLISSGEKSPITITGEPSHPDLDGGKVVYEVRRNGDSDIMLYDFNGQNETVISSGEGDQVRPSLSGDHVVFEDLRGTEPVVMVYSISSRELRELSPVSGTATPQISDGVVVFLDRDGIVLNRYSLP